MGQTLTADACMESKVGTDGVSMTLNSTTFDAVARVPEVAADCSFERQGSSSFSIAYLFSGPVRTQDGFATQVKSLGGTCVCYDTEISESHDMLDQHGWETIDKDTDSVDGYLLSPPCSTFSPARNSNDGGPQPLRSAVGPEVYGLKNLRPEDKEKVRAGNVLALRARQKAMSAVKTRRPFILEQPHHREGKTSMFLLDEFVELLHHPDVHVITLAQCRFGCVAEKLTDLVTNVDRQHLTELEVLCNHEKRWWTIPWSGKSFFAAHPPLVGTQLAIPSEQWDDSMLTGKPPRGDFLTRAAAAYPADLNKALAVAFSKACNSMRSIPDAVTSKSGDLDNKVEMGLPLKQHIKVDDAKDDINSLRNIHKSVTDKALYVGKQVANLIEKHLDEGDVEQHILSNIGKNIDDIDVPTQWVDNLRIEVLRLLSRNRLPEMDQACDLDPINTTAYQTSIRGNFLEYWGKVVSDPGAKIARWTFEGAPAGIDCDTSDLDGICPGVEVDEEHDAAELFTDFDTFENYEGVEDDPEAELAVTQYHSKGYLKKFDTVDELQQFVGGRPVLSKLGCIKNFKFNPDTNQYTQKVRIILDCKQSQVSTRARRTHKSVLPRVSDAVQAALALSYDRYDNEQIQMFIIDIVDAFWLVPLRHLERKYFCARLKGSYYAFLRTAQGSRGAPLTFAALIALASRLIQSLISGPQMNRWAREEGRMNVYVDDPIVIMRGSESRIRRVAAMVIVGWLLLGFPLAFHKAVLSPTVLWVGITLQVTTDTVRAEVPESKVLELKDLILTNLRSNVMPIKVLRTTIGKAMAIASVIYVWRPFVQELYSALHAEKTNAPKGCIWTKQVHHSFSWILAFLAGEQGSIIRDYSLSHFRREGPGCCYHMGRLSLGNGCYPASGRAVC